MRLRLLLLLALVLGVAACTASPPDRPDASPSPLTPSASTRTPVVRPEVGACYRMSRAQALAPVAGGRQVPCRERHTAQTFRVGTLDLGDEDEPRAVDSPRVQAQPRRACTAALPSYAGASARALRLSLLRAIWFTPTVEEAAAGADWFRCDVVALGAGDRLAPLPRATRGLLARDTTSYAVCGTAEPGSPRFARVPCSARHAWVAISTVDLRGRAYPSAAEVSRQVSDACRSAARARAGDPLDFRWAEERPTRAQWEAGQRWGTCWSPR